MGFTDTYSQDNASNNIIADDESLLFKIEEEINLKKFIKEVFVVHLGLFYLETSLSDHTREI